MAEMNLETYSDVSKELSNNPDDCHISSELNSEMRSMLNDILSDVSSSENSHSNDDINIDSEPSKSEVSDLVQAQFEPRSTYFQDGHSFETDNNGVIYKKDGELIPGTEYEINGGKYKVDTHGNQEVIQEGFISSYKERLDYVPRENSTNVRGQWSGERGESLFVPNSEYKEGQGAAQKLEEYQLDGIEYHDAVPDFSKCAEDSVEIDMTANRYNGNGNFEKASTACAEKWNSEGYQGKTNWTPRDVDNYRAEHNMTWHECPDRKTCQMVPREIHDFFTHTGGVFECKKNIARDTVGGGFDD